MHDLERDRFCSAGLLYFYIVGMPNEENMMAIRAMDTYGNLPEMFYEKVLATAEGVAEFDDCIELFGVVGAHDKVNSIREMLVAGLRENCNALLARKSITKQNPMLDAMGNCFYELVQTYFCGEAMHYPEECSAGTEDWSLFCLYPAEAEKQNARKNARIALEVWLEKEKPKMMGKQIMTQSFLLSDLVGKKVIAKRADAQSDHWNLIFEGGIKLSIGTNMISYPTKAYDDDIFGLSVSQIDTILNDCVYAYGEGLVPGELYTQWDKVFLYACALCDTKWTQKSIAKVYDRFLLFLKENICQTMQAPALVKKDIFLMELLANIDKVRAFLRGEDEAAISKEVLHLLGSRYVYLPYIYDLIKCVPAASATEFCVQQFRQLIADADAESAYEKGKRWEAVAKYVLQTVPGLKITGQRVKAGHQEIDLSVANRSLSDFLWQLGAYILVECKNRRKKVGIATIRNIAYISQMKGNKTAFLFTSSGITRDARQEIVRLAVNDMYVLVITKADLLRLQCAEDCLVLLMQRWDALQAAREKKFVI